MCISTRCVRLIFTQLQYIVRLAPENLFSTVECDEVCIDEASFNRTKSVTLSICSVKVTSRKIMVGQGNGDEMSASVDGLLLVSRRTELNEMRCLC